MTVDYCPVQPPLLLKHSSNSISLSLSLREPSTHVRHAKKRHKSQDATSRSICISIGSRLWQHGSPRAPLFARLATIFEFTQCRSRFRTNSEYSIGIDTPFSNVLTVPHRRARLHRATYVAPEAVQERYSRPQWKTSTAPIAIAASPTLFTRHTILGYIDGDIRAVLASKSSYRRRNRFP